MRILYLDLDTLRPDHLGCYGYHRNTSPNIDKIAEKGVRFTNYYCSDAPCLPSRTAMMTGRFGIHTGVVDHAGTCADMRLEGTDRGFVDSVAHSSLPAFIKQNGLRTVYIGGFPERHASWNFYAGFREIHDTGMGGMESAEHVSPDALDWINRNAESDDWYLHVNYWDPHTPYRAPAEFGNPFEDEPLPQWYTEELIEKHRAMAGPHGARETNMYNSDTNPRFPRHPGEICDMHDMRRMIDGYDCGIRYLDEHIGGLFDALESAGVLEDTAIIISADHGENMGELGLYGEHATADHVTCRIPMIIHWPGVTVSHVDDGLHYNLDLAPTLADVLGTPPKALWEGQSYAPVLRESVDCGRDYLVISQCAHVCQRAVRWDSWLYVRTYHDGYHLFPRDMLFDLSKDPREENNLAPQRKDVCMQGAWYLSEWHDDMMHTMPNGYAADPLWTVMTDGGPFHAKGHLAKYCERLEATGRGEHVEKLRKRHPGEFPKDS